MDGLIDGKGGEGSKGVYVVGSIILLLDVTDIGNANSYPLLPTPYSSGKHSPHHSFKGVYSAVVYGT